MCMSVHVSRGGFAGARRHSTLQSTFSGIVSIRVVLGLQTDEERQGHIKCWLFHIITIKNCIMAIRNAKLVALNIYLMFCIYSYIFLRANLSHSNQEL